MRLPCARRTLLLVIGVPLVLALHSHPAHGWAIGSQLDNARVAFFRIHANSPPTGEAPPPVTALGRTDSWWSTQVGHRAQNMHY